MNAKVAAKVRIKTKKEHHRAKTARREPGAKKCQSQTSRPAPFAQQERTPQLPVREAKRHAQVVRQARMDWKSEPPVWNRAASAKKIRFLRWEDCAAPVHTGERRLKVVFHAPRVQLEKPL